MVVIMMTGWGLAPGSASHQTQSNISSFMNEANHQYAAHTSTIAKTSFDALGGQHGLGYQGWFLGLGNQGWFLEQT